MKQTFGKLVELPDGESTGGMHVMETANLIWGLIFSSIGMGYFIYGRKQSNLVARYCGIALILYPYLVTNTLAIVGIGIALMLAPRFIEL